MRYATLSRMNPWRELASLQAEVDRLFDGSCAAPGCGTQVYPAVDVLRDDTQIIVRADLPGVSKENIEISILKNRLFIRGEKKQEATENGQNEQRIERAYGKFERVVDLPGHINQEAVKASVTDGVLEIVAPLQEEAKPRQIPLEVN